MKSPTDWQGSALPRLFRGAMNYAAEHPGAVHGGAVMALVAIGGRLLLLKVDERVPFGYEFGVFVYDFSFAYLAAWVFHVIAVLVPVARRRGRVEVLVARRLDRIVRHAQYAAARVHDAAGLDKGSSLPPSAESIESALKNTQGADLIYAAEWVESIEHLLGQAERDRAGIVPFSTELDSDLLGILQDEEDAGDAIVRLAEMGRSLNRTKPDLIESPLQRWFLACAALQDVRANGFGRHHPLPEPLARDAFIVTPRLAKTLRAELREAEQTLDSLDKHGHLPPPGASLP